MLHTKVKTLNTRAAKFAIKEGIPLGTINARIKLTIVITKKMIKVLFALFLSILHLRTGGI